jgi:hypothetical protein
MITIPIINLPFVGSAPLAGSQGLYCPAVETMAEEQSGRALCSNATL